MNEKDLKILEQYDICIDKTYRGRGSYLCESGRNIYLLKEYTVSEEKATTIAGILDFLYKKFDLNVDCYLKNKEGKYITKDKDGVGFIVKKWNLGKECDTKNISDIEKITAQMAKLHVGFRKIDKVTFVHEPVLLNDSFDKKIREMKKIRNYINKKKGKTQFELLYMNQFNYFLKLAEDALDGANALNIKPFFLCHGDFNHHNVLISEDDIYIVNFDKCHYGSQVEDLYLFMRKILEKNNWDVSVGAKMLESYNSINQLSENEKKELYFRFMFPEKFWKISNHYYNAKKVWGVERNQNKLDKLNEQVIKKQNFMEYMKV